MTNTFSIGDTVSLRSGGVAMTVDEMKPDGVKVTWVDATGEDRACLFSPRCLAPIVLKCVMIEWQVYRYVWVFAESGFPIADHITIADPIGEQK
jgi:uncharacterized protein YodC (DUF2158 family)